MGRVARVPARLPNNATKRLHTACDRQAPALAGPTATWQLSKQEMAVEELREKLEQALSLPFDSTADAQVRPATPQR